ncbi:hypothetical protein H6G54_05415 [Anabaena cylindrica FACHB-243]|uniref:Uncharacterized protein n=1 Tax=Anabaena cylindrica (strain ATCC 27899 / PCC 7122) TaxID=272123 RepID=K9ZKJ3_ANACC|nr:MULTISPECIES: hypothetical protein [Anabaena]AFZ59753.1 hypothetical protein Anacy_4393 [Anabaena cylindrica PCC 7122]MBD2417158.1 hypothetical protein [Anabaena cylindrica FACHB-243]MBY5283626.1 hypothetical protein [Anabaena sp. CCAP 1446/1C]MBY5310258.1 hypothetical protein [Anabaena sp. CCAP 1446/1C]MCM2405026.1 hypothetical protein [Anabaena sp. CCAP 1446/1C]
MNKKLILNLLASSSIFTSLMSTLGIINPAHAGVDLNQRLIHTNDGRTCITNPHGMKDFVCIRDAERDPKAAPAPKSMVLSMQPSDSNIAELDFTEEESDAAIRIFSCDCPFCVNSLRQLRGTGNLVY